MYHWFFFAENVDQHSVTVNKESHRQNIITAIMKELRLFLPRTKFTVEQTMA